MSAKRNRKRASKARRRQALLSLRAELVLLFDGDPVPPVYMTYRAKHTRDLINSIKHYGSVPEWMRPQPTYKSAVEAEIDRAGRQLMQAVDKEMLRTISVP